MNKRSVAVIACCVSAVAVFFTLSFVFRQIFFTGAEGIGLWITLLESLGLVATILVAIIQLKDSKEISRGDFIIELNRSFVENPDYINVYNELQSCVDGKCEYKVNGICTRRECKLKFEKSTVSNYLTFFETVYLLSKRNVISFDIIDDLFAYRFFLAVHSRVFQREKLMSQPENFKNIFLLEKEWLDHRVKNGKLSREALDKACDEYRQMLVNKDDENALDFCVPWKNVYIAYQLRAIMPEEEYNKLIKS